ncbi:DNA-binding protein [Deltaproteobacteria bacterium]|nr:DNA-binding protein [Deltaproteobacteria bacterium]
MKNKIRAILSLINQGWLPYDVRVDDAVYEKLNCPHLSPMRPHTLAQTRPRTRAAPMPAPMPATDAAQGDARKNRRAQWFFHREKFLCLGCEKSCALVNPAGFQLPLPLEYAAKKPDVCVSLETLLREKLVLRPDEAAKILDVTHRQIREWVHEGLLDAARGKPLRVTTKSIKNMLGEK